MPIGFQSFYADGSLQLTVTDRTSRLVKAAEISLPSTWPPGADTRDVVVPGIKNDGTWYISCTGQVLVTIYDGYFRIVRVDKWGLPNPENDNLYYSVIRI